VDSPTQTSRRLNGLESQVTLTMLPAITPLILTYNEAPNVGRTLEQLHWASDIVVVDSFSDDETLEIISRFPQVRVIQRQFDSFAAQCNFGLRETGIKSEWVLSLDADYLLTPEIVEEFASLESDGSFDGYRARFAYCINGRHLRSGVYPPVTVLFRRARASYRDDGHAHRVAIDGPVGKLRACILHDDRKSLARWFESQQRYMALEAGKILAAEPGSLAPADRVRRLRVIAPLAVCFYCLLIRGGVLDGWAGFYYAFQRTFAELLLSLYLIEHDFNAATDPRSGREQTTNSEELVVSTKRQ
jgi:glycosyltransferase involved in cell wall biosynthesis